MRACCSLVYVGLRPRPAAMSSTSRPRWLKRLTTLLTPSRLRPTSCPAVERVPPAATHSSALARRTVSTRSLVAFTIRCSCCSSSLLKGRKGSLTGLPIAGFLLVGCFFSVSHLSFLFATQLLADPVGVSNCCPSAERVSMISCCHLSNVA